MCLVENSIASVENFHISGKVHFRIDPYNQKPIYVHISPQSTVGTDVERARSKGPCLIIIIIIILPGIFALESRSVVAEVTFCAICQNDTKY